MTRSVRLSRRLILENRTNLPDGSGGYATTWQTLGVVWADVAARTERQDFIAGQERPRVTYRILVRGAPVGAPSRPRAEQRFRDTARVFNILTVTEADVAGRFLEILAEEGIQR